MTKKNQPKRYDPLNNEDVCGYKGDSPVAEEDTLALLRTDVDSLKVAVAELKAALAALAGASKPQASPLDGSTVNATGEPVATLPAGVLGSDSQLGALDDSALPDAPSLEDRPSVDEFRASDDDLP